MNIPDYNKGSMLLWHPVVSKLDIPQPRTVTLIINGPAQSYIDAEKTNFESLPWEEIRKCADSIGYPLFFRTDQASHKHGWKRGSYIEKPEDLKTHVSDVVEFNHMVGMFGLPYKAFVFRQYIPMGSTFTAFYGDMPVNPERRYFIGEGKVVCRHEYWVEGAIQNASVPDWKEKLALLNRQPEYEKILLGDYAEQVSRALPGDWSVDFCRDSMGKWWLIDMAAADASFHVPGCPNNRWNAEMMDKYLEGD